MSHPATPSASLLCRTANPYTIRRDDPVRRAARVPFEALKEAGIRAERGPWDSAYHGLHGQQPADGRQSFPDGVGYTVGCCVTQGR